MALTIVPTANQVFTGVSTAGGFSFADLRNLGFFEPGEPVSLGSCFLDYTVGITSDPYDPVIGVSTYNVGVPSTGTISPTDLVGAVRELKLEISGSDSKVDLKNLAFGSEQTKNIRKTVAITTNCVITSDDPTVAALSITGGYNNLRINISGQLLGASGEGAAQGSGNDGGTGGAALSVTNTSGIGAKIQVTPTGQLKAGGGGGGAGENGVSGTSVQYNCGTYCIGKQESCRPGCCYDCGGGFFCCFNPCASTGTNTCTASGGSAGQGGTGGRGRGGDYPSGSLDGAEGTDGGANSGNGSTDGTDGGDGGAGGDYGQPGNPGGPAPSTGAGNTGGGGQPGYAITGAYGLAGFIVGVVTGILPPPVYGFTDPANATVGFAGTQQVWEFTSIGSTSMSIAKTQGVRIVVVSGGGQGQNHGSGGAGGGYVHYYENYQMQAGVWNLTVGGPGGTTTIAHDDGTKSFTASAPSNGNSAGGIAITYDDSGNGISTTVYTSKGGGGNSHVVHGPNAGGGGGGVVGGGGGGSTSGGVCWKAYPGGGDNDCSTGPYSANGGGGGAGLTVDVRISGNHTFGSGGGGAAGASGNCGGCGVGINHGPNGAGTYGRGRHFSGENQGGFIEAGQGGVFIRFLDFVP